MDRLGRLSTAGLALLVVLLWGGSFAITKVALRELGPLTIAFYRWAIGSAAFALLLPLLGQTVAVRKALRKDLPTFALLGLIGISAFYALQNIALRYTTAVHVGILINVCTIFIAVLGAVFLRERMGGVAAGGLSVGFLGATIVSVPPGGITARADYLLGDALTVGAALCAAMYTVQGKRILTRYPPLVVTGLAAGFGTLFLLPVAAIEGLSLPSTWQVWCALLVLGLGSSALANFWWWRILQRMDASRAGVFLLVIPVVSTLLAIVWLGEPLQMLTLVGMALVLIGVYLTQRAR